MDSERPASLSSEPIGCFVNDGFTRLPAVAPLQPLELERPDGRHSPVERAIRIGLGREPDAEQNA